MIVISTKFICRQVPRINIHFNDFDQNTITFNYNIQVFSTSKMQTNKFCLFKETSLDTKLEKVHINHDFIRYHKMEKGMADGALIVDLLTLLYWS